LGTFNCSLLKLSYLVGNYFVLALEGSVDFLDLGNLGLFIHYFLELLGHFDRFFKNFLNAIRNFIPTMACLLQMLVHLVDMNSLVEELFEVLSPFLLLIYFGFLNLFQIVLHFFFHFLFG